VSTVLDVVSAVLLLSGVALAVIAGLGLVRLPDVFSRMHAATKPATLGLVLVLLGAALRVEDGSDAATLLLVGAFQFLTAPVGAHIIGRSAYRAGAGALDDLVVDELRERDPS
jgi:multicomponent Na+:H+ antiporter subunit G